MSKNSGKIQSENTEKEALAKARKKVDIANKCRLAFLFIAVIVLLFIYFGNKVWEGIGWYDNTVFYLYNFLFMDIFLMLIATLIKIFFATRYNKIVKRL